MRMILIKIRLRKIVGLQKPSDEKISMIEKNHRVRESHSKSFWDVDRRGALTSRIAMETIWNARGDVPRCIATMLVVSIVMMFQYGDMGLGNIVNETHQNDIR